MAAEIVGHVTCPFCLSRAPVRLNKSSRRYVSCQVCGPIQAHGASVQDWIEDNIEDEPPAEPAVPVDYPEPDAEPDDHDEQPASAPGKRRPWLIEED